jgi:hypothetical protein
MLPIDVAHFILTNRRDKAWSAFDVLRGRDEFVIDEGEVRRYQYRATGIHGA